MGRDDSDKVSKLINFAAEMGMGEITAFVGSLAPTKSAIQIGGDDATIKIDIPLTAPLFGERSHPQRPAVWTLDTFQRAQRKIIFLAILVPSEQSDMFGGGHGGEEVKPKDPPPTTPPAGGPSSDGEDESETPATVTVVHQHLHVHGQTPDDLMAQIVGRSPQFALAAGGYGAQDDGDDDGNDDGASDNVLEAGG